MNDWRLPEHRRSVFQDFYEFHLRHRSHPGAVYYLMPFLAERYGWGPEEKLWFAFLNGNTQNPITSLLLFEMGGSPGRADLMLSFYRANYGQLAFDTDRRYHKKSLEKAVAGYLAMLGGRTQEAFWAAAAGGGWPSVWDAARSIPTFGRLSAFSYAEYLRIMGADFDCDDLMLGDIAGSRSHRNGLCIVTGHDDWDWHESNPLFPGIQAAYRPEAVEYLNIEARRLLTDAKARAYGEPWAADVSYFTLESTLCTYKGWHRPNRRYPNVYNDMLYDRLNAAGKTWAREPGFLDVFWEARAASLPAYLRLEDMPGDPGLAPVKQNWYRETGEVIVMGREYDRYWSTFDAAVDAGELGTFREVKAALG